MAVTADGALHTAAGAQLLEVSDDGRTAFAAAGTCVLRNGTVWVGDCAEGGDMDGARGSGVARLGTLLDLALMEHADATPVLFLSTASASCFSIRGASLYDGALSTMVGSDATRLPVRLLAACPRYPFALAVARGTDELVYASGGDVWRYRVLQDDQADHDTPFLTLPDRILAVATRGYLDRGGMLVLATAGYLAVWQDGQYTRLPSNVTTLRLQAAGRRAWWLAGDGGVWTAGLTAAREGCVRGYVQIAGARCAQVGAGQQALTDDAVVACPPGTYSLGADPCAPCPPGAYAPTGAFGCDPCPAGTLAYGGDCVDACPAGTYLLDTACTPCPSGSSAPRGASAKAACTPCPAGTYVNASTGGLCAACPPQTTSLAGSFRCVVVCPPGQCAPTGDACAPLTQNWQIITPIHVLGGAQMHGVTIGAGGAIFYTDGDQLFHFSDDCGMDTGLVSTCQREGAALLPPLVAPSLVRGFTALALARTFVAGTNTRMLYVASYVFHAVYGFPIVFQTGSAVLVDVEATRQRLLQNPAGTSDDRSGLSQWRFVGGPTPGFADGAAARFNMPSEVELSNDDARLYVSDFFNARIRVVDLATRVVSTVLGGGADCWNYGSTRASCAPLCGPGCASASRPLGMGIAPDDVTLYVVQNALDSLGALDLRAQTFAPYCMLNFDNAERYTTERCSLDAGSRTCMLYMPWDVLASASGRVYVAVTNAIVIIDTTTLACQQIAGEFWTYYDNWGFRDGQVQVDGAPSSLLNRPTKLALDGTRGILYVADYSNGALRRVFVDGQCRCAEGALFLPAAQVIARARDEHVRRVARAQARQAEPAHAGPEDVEGVVAVGRALHDHDVVRDPRLEVEQRLAVLRVGDLRARQRLARLPQRLKRAQGARGRWGLGEAAHRAPVRAAR